MNSVAHGTTTQSELPRSRSGPSQPYKQESFEDERCDAAATVPLLLIHGVGHFQSGDIEEKVAKGLRERGIDGISPMEFDWDQRVKQFDKSASSEMNWGERVHRLGLALSRAAWLNVDASERTVPRAVRLLWATLPVLLGVALALLLWWGLALAVSTIPPDTAPPLRVGLPWTSYIFPPLPQETFARSASAAGFAVVQAVRLLGAVAAAIALVTWLAARMRPAVILRLVTLQLLWPPVYALGALPFVLRSLAAMSIGIAFASGFASIKGTVALADGSIWDVGPGFLQLASGIGAMLGLAAAAFGIAWVAWRVLKPVFDVAFYLGDGEIRDFILEQLEEVVGAIPPGRRIIIGAHSLGSVIAVDSLLKSRDVWLMFDRIDLVTAGSPLQRLLARFFPKAYPAPGRLAADLGASHGDVRWTNVYRVTDYVGGTLSGDAIVNERLHRRWWRNHANYWTDPDVIDRLAGRLRSVEQTIPARNTAGTPSCLPVRFQTAHLPQFRYLRYLVPATTVAGLIGIVWNQFVATPSLERRNLASWHAQIDAAPVDTNVRVGTGEFIDTAAETGSYEIVGFTYAVDGASYVAESPPDWIPYATSRFPHVDWRRLKHDVREAGEEFETVVEYASSNPAIFRLKDYVTDPPYYSIGRLTFYTLRTVILSVFWFFWCVILYLILNGLSPSAEKQESPGPSHRQ